MLANRWLDSTFWNSWVYTYRSLLCLGLRLSAPQTHPVRVVPRLGRDGPVGSPRCCSRARRRGSTPGRRSDEAAGEPWGRPPTGTRVAAPVHWAVPAARGWEVPGVVGPEESPPPREGLCRGRMRALPSFCQGEQLGRGRWSTASHGGLGSTFFLCICEGGCFL